MEEIIHDIFKEKDFLSQITNEFFFFFFLVLPFLK